MLLPKPIQPKSLNGAMAKRLGRASIIRQWQQRHAEAEKRWGQALAKAFAAAFRAAAKVLVSAARDGNLTGKLVDKVGGSELFATMMKSAKPEVAKLIRLGAVDEFGLHVRGRAAYPYLVKRGTPEAIKLPPRVEKRIDQFARDILSQPYWEDAAKDVRRSIAQAISSSQKEGESNDDLANRIDDILGLEQASGRGMRIARTETTASLNAGASAAREELAKQGLIKAKEWVATLDDVTRDDHADTNGQRVDWDEDFDVGGESAQYPGDFRLSAGNRCNCFPPDVCVQGVFNTAMRSFYSGKIVEIITGTGRRLSLTPQHPVLTKDGFVSACKLQCGQELLAYDSEVNFFIADRMSKQIYNMPVKIEEIFRAFKLVGFSKIINATAVDFNGDGHFLQSNIEIVLANRKLLINWKARRSNECLDFFFMCEDPEAFNEFRHCALRSSFWRVDGTTTTVPGGRALLFDNAPVGFYFTPLQLLCRRSSAQGYSGFLKSQNQTVASYSVNTRERKQRFACHVSGDDFLNRKLEPASNSGKLANVFSFSQDDVSSSESEENYAETDVLLARDLLERNTGMVFLDKIIQIQKHSGFHGHVYDLQSPGGFIIANGIFTSNCRCTCVSIDIEE